MNYDYLKEKIKEEARQKELEEEEARAAFREEFLKEEMETAKLIAEQFVKDIETSIRWYYSEKDYILRNKTKSFFINLDGKRDYEHYAYIKLPTLFHRTYEYNCSHAFCVHLLPSKSPYIDLRLRAEAGDIRDLPCPDKQCLDALVRDIDSILKDKDIHITITGPHYISGHSNSYWFSVTANLGVL